MNIDEVAAAIHGYHFTYANEAELHDGLAGALADAGFSPRREVILDGASRIDLLIAPDADHPDWVPPGIGIEVKVQGRGGDVAKQCARYLRFEAIEGLILVTTRGRHGQLARVRDIEGKPFRVVTLRSF